MMDTIMTAFEFFAENTINFDHLPTENQSVTYHIKTYLDFIIL